jgi:hypothetical protein
MTHECTSDNEMAVVHTVRQDLGREFLTIDCPNGRDGVKKLTRKVLTYDGRKFVFTGWDSGSLKSCFFRNLDRSMRVSTVGLQNWGRP